MKKKKQKEELEEFEKDYDEYFAYIVDYTDGGAPYGITWEEEGISTDIPVDERYKLLMEKYENERIEMQNKRKEPKEVNVSVEEIAEKLDEVMEGWEQFLNIKTGELIALPSNDNWYVDMDEQYLKQWYAVESTFDYLRLPDQYEINEYQIMSEFAYSYKNEKIAIKLQNILNRRKPFRHFKDEINYLGIAKEYYLFKDQQLVKIAHEWCEINNVICKK